VDLGTLLTELAQAPHLQGARCRKHPRLWDGATASDAELARYICVRECPCVERCRDYLQHRVFPISGVIAGELHRVKPAKGDGADQWIDAKRSRSRVKNVTPDNSRPGQAARWLASFLASAGSAASSTDVLAAAEAAGYNRQLLHIARHRLGVVTTREADHRHTVWTLPARRRANSPHTHPGRTE
jgi:hypothetical protein